MASQQELACIYAALALQDEEVLFSDVIISYLILNVIKVSITGEKIQTLLNAAGVTVEPFWPGLYAKALEGVDIKVKTGRNNNPDWCSLSTLWSCSNFLCKKWM